MPTLSACALLAILSPRVSSLGIQFINPPTHGTDGGLSNPPTYKQDYTINIQWYPGDETGPYDLVLHQVKTLGQEQTGDGEFIMRKSHHAQEGQLRSVASKLIYRKKS